MTTMIQCDRCGVLEETKGTTVAATGPFTLPVFRETPLPDGWRRPVVPHEDGSAWKKDLCPGCVNALWEFMASPAWFDGPAEAPAGGEGAGGCTCPQPEKPRPPCPQHAPREETGEGIPGRDRKECPVGTLDGCPGWYRVGGLDDHMQRVHGTSQR